MWELRIKPFYLNIFRLGSTIIKQFWLLLTPKMECDNREAVYFETLIFAIIPLFYNFEFFIGFLKCCMYASFFDP